MCSILMRKFCYICRVLGKEGASHLDLGTYVSFGGGFGQFGDTIRESFRIHCETARLFGLAFE